MASSRFHIIWLIASGSGVSECAAASGYSVRWIEKLARRYNAGGPDSLGDRCLANKGAKPLLTAEQLVSLAKAVASPPLDGGLLTGPRVTAWIGRETGRAHVHPRRGWAYLRRLDQSWQTATPAEQEAIKKLQETVDQV